MLDFRSLSKPERNSSKRTGCLTQGIQKVTHSSFKLHKLNVLFPSESARPLSAPSQVPHYPSLKHRLILDTPNSQCVGKAPKPCPSQLSSKSNFLSFSTLRVPPFLWHGSHRPPPPLAELQEQPCSGPGEPITLILPPPCWGQAL